jgi:hypothetical protein
MLKTTLAFVETAVSPSKRRSGTTTPIALR